MTTIRAVETEKRKRKIVFLLTSFNHAGAESQVVQLAQGFHYKGWRILIISMIAPTASLTELDKLGIEFKMLGMHKGLPDPRAIYRLKRLLEQFDPDIVHSHMVHANILARITRLFVHMPVLIATAHNSIEGGRLRTWMYRLTDPLCQLTTNVSQDAVDRYIRIKAVPRHKIRLMPNGVNLDDFGKDDEASVHIREEQGLKDEFIWLAVGRMTEAKDYPAMLTAFAQLVRDHQDQDRACVLFIVGEGLQNVSLVELAHTLHIINHVRFLGIRSDISRLMNAADGYVMSSLWEGMPMVLLEASACELPIVTTNVGGNREVVLDGVSGFLTEPAQAAQLTDQMRALMQMTSLERERMGVSARKHVVDKYSMTDIIDRWESIYVEYANARVSRTKLEESWE